jgi:hypothetical protein
MVNAFHCCTFWEVYCLKLAYFGAEKGRYQCEKRLKQLSLLDLQRKRFGGLNLH